MLITQLLFLAFASTTTGQASDKHRNIHAALSKYNRHLPPRFDFIPINVTVLLSGFFGIERKSQTAIVTTAVLIEWTDDRFSAINFTFDVASSRIWTPRLGCLIDATFTRLHDEHGPVHFRPGGHLSMYQSFYIQSRIDFDERTYPFDSQSISTWLTPSHMPNNFQLNLINHSSKLNARLSNGERVNRVNGEWSLQEFHCDTGNIADSGLQITDYVHCKLRLSRNGVPYLFTSIGPQIVLLCIALIGILSGGSNQQKPRAHTAVTACVAVAVTLASKSSDMPAKYTWNVPWFVSINMTIINTLFITTALQEISLYYRERADMVSDGRLRLKFVQFTRSFRKAALFAAPAFLSLHLAFWLIVYFAT